MGLISQVREFLTQLGLIKRSYESKEVDLSSKVLQKKETPDLIELSCEHGPARSKLKVTILGVECEFKESPLCSICTEKYLNKNSTLCASCKRPIFPGTPIGQAWEGAPNPFTHLTSGCCESGGLYCGQWGEGRLITLHELDPEKYPPGEYSVVSLVFSSGSTIAGKIH